MKVTLAMLKKSIDPQGPMSSSGLKSPSVEFGESRSAERSVDGGEAREAKRRKSDREGHQRRHAPRRTEGLLASEELVV